MQFRQDAEIALVQTTVANSPAPQRLFYQCDTVKNNKNETKCANSMKLTTCVQKKTPTHVFFHISMNDVIGVFTIGPLGPCPFPLNWEQFHIWLKHTTLEKLPQWKITKIVATRLQILRPIAPNSISAEAPPQTPLGNLQRSPRSSSWILNRCPTSKGREGENRDRRVYLC